MAALLTNSPSKTKKKLHNSYNTTFAFLSSLSDQGKIYSSFQR